MPSILRLLLPALSAARDRLGLQLLVSSGEPLAVAAAAELQRALPPGASLLNLYGASFPFHSHLAWRASVHASGPDYIDGLGLCRQHGGNGRLYLV